MQITKNQSKALEILKENQLDVFTLNDIMLLLNLNKSKTYNLIKSLKKNDIIEKIKGHYCLKGTDEMVTASRAVFPSYISFLSALNYYGLTDQFPIRITLISTKKHTHKDYIIATVNRNKFFGYTNVNNITIAEKEKAVIDSLYLPKYAGGIKTIMGCFEHKLDKKTLYEYAVKMDNKAVLRRLGYITDILNIKFPYKLKIGKGYELLDPSKPKKNNYNKKWLLDVNI